MVFKVLGIQDGGTATLLGGDDFDKIAKLLNGDHDVEDVYINSYWEFKDDTLHLRNQANTASATIRTGSISSDVEYSFPTHDVNSQIVLDSAPQTLTNKVIDASQNTLIGIGSGSSASTKKTGLILAPMNALGGTVGSGSLAGHIDMGAVVTNQVAPPPQGTYWRYETGTTINTNAGLRWDAAYLRRDFNPRLKVKFKTPVSAEGHQLLVGFSSSTDILPTQDPILSSESGLLVGYSDEHDSYTTIRNAGTTAQTYTPTVAPVSEVLKSDSAVRVVEIAFQDDGDKAVITIQYVDIVPPYATHIEFTDEYTTNLPAMTEPGSGKSVYLRPVCQITNQITTNNMLELSYMELESSF